jgi:hypothetical protein
MENFCIKSTLLIVILLTYVSFVFIIQNWRQSLNDKFETLFMSIFTLGVLVLAATILFWYVNMADAHDAKRPDLNQWFEELHSNKGPCCSDADGALVQDADWDTIKGNDGIVHYRVRIGGQWVDVPDEAVVREPNLYGQTVVWGSRSWYDNVNTWTIRCFIPGSMT